MRSRALSTSGADPDRAAPHLTPLSRPEWALWALVGLRSAGFPVSGVLRLATADGPALAAEAHAIAGDGRFQEALLWQNRDAFHTGVAPLLAKPPGSAPRNSRYRRAEELVASYWQRYCTKNDTTGFVGPTAWARWGREPGVQVRVGPALLAGCRARFEVWAIEALARAIAREPGCAPWLRPRRMPFVHVEGATLLQPNRPPEALPPAQAALLAACDGRRTARDLAAARPDASEADVYALLEELRGRRLISWAPDVPVQTHPERHLRALLQGIGEPALREDALARLDRLEAGLEEVRASAGDARRLDGALGRLNDAFTSVTGAAPTRSPGAVHRGRTLAYHECLRDVEVAVGPDVLRALDEPLGLLLTAARWVTYELAARCRRALDEVFAGLAGRKGAPAVDFPTFWFAALPRLRDPGLGLAVRRELQRRWAAVLAVAPDAKEVVYRSEEIAAAVEEAFAAPGPGWPGARYHTPDLMIDAPSAEAVGRGDYRLVLGELHVAINALRHASFVDMHPAPGELFAALQSDVPEARVVPVPPRSGAWGTSRGHQGLVSPRDWRISFLHDPGGHPEDRSLPMGSLLVERGAADGLVVRARDRDLRLDAVEVFADALTDVAYDQFEILAPAPHLPRVAFDRLVVCRERWCFRGPDLAFARERDEAARFAAARRWRDASGLPRFAFARMPGEKAIYVDFDSLPYVNLLARAARRVPGDGLVELTEMLPDHGGCWLADAAGDRYTSELRTIAVDRGAVAK